MSGGIPLDRRWSLPFRFGSACKPRPFIKRVDGTEDRNFVGLRRTVRREKANSWEFPLALKYAWEFGAVKPFVAAGGSVRWINSFESSVETFELVPGAQQPYGLSEFRIDDAVAEAGWVTGGGVRFDT